MQINVNNLSKLKNKKNNNNNKNIDNNKKSNTNIDPAALLSCYWWVQESELQALLAAALPLQLPPACPSLINFLILWKGRSAWVVWSGDVMCFVGAKRWRGMWVIVEKIIE